MDILVDGVRFDNLTSLFKGKEIAIAIDSSKTNTALDILDLETGEEKVVELGGKSVKDVQDLCVDHRKQLTNLFRGSTIKIVGIEDILTKKNEGMKNTHEVRFILTFVYSSLLILFEDTFGVRPIPINNQSWKNLTIGPELNKKSIYKGSVDYVYDKYPKYRGFSDDATDAICIMEYMKQVYKLNTYVKAVEIERASYNVVYTLMSSSLNVRAKKFNEFGYNYDLGIEDNVAFVSNRAKANTYSFCQIDPNKMSIEDLTNNIDMKGKYLKSEPFLYLVIYHKEGRG